MTEKKRNSESFFFFHSGVCAAALSASAFPSMALSTHRDEEASERKEKILFNILDWHNNEAETRRNKTLANIHFAREAHNGFDGEWKAEQHEYLNGMQNDFTILGTSEEVFVVRERASEDAPEGETIWIFKNCTEPREKYASEEDEDIVEARVEELSSTIYARR
jgi:hypothetical protein